MSFTIEPLEGLTLGAIVRDIELPLIGEADFSRLLSAFHEHALLIFPAQHLSANAQADFARRFGDIEVLAAGMTTVPLSNKADDGRLMDPDCARMKLLRGNEGWHTDSSYMPVSSKCAVLSALVVPPEGGETEWADCRAAFDVLDSAFQAKLRTLNAYHDYFYSQARVGHDVKVGEAYGFYAGEKPLRPLVKKHPVTGREALFIGRHACRVTGMDAAESERLLDELTTLTCQSPRVYRHRWQVGDTVLWDNRALLHRARPYDPRHERVMQHTRIRGERETEAALNVDQLAA